ncbi:response regulator receiver [Cyanobacterium stanieri PCC 7202]|uniref:Response regulator receiver n=1 Tax=Cyanobacterium stanieri (strain ATCC 29140 / PCC 7202) TaxID=292563 RepID=K9YNW3_CYASC|nr:response regulator receiver [Cyanobacterium stanieri PCC 7202]
MKNDANVNILLIDDDPIFRLGLIALIQEQSRSNIRILAQGAIADTLGLLKEYSADLLLISLDLAVEPNKINRLMSLSRKLTVEYPDLPILVITPWGSDENIKNISNVKGCCPRNISIPELIKGIKLCAKGKTYYVNIKNKNRKLIGGWLYRQCELGLREIERSIREVNNHLKGSNLSALDILFWQGRRRELRVVKWIVRQFIPSPNGFVNGAIEEEENQEDEDSVAKLPPNQVNPNMILAPKNELDNEDLITKKIQGSLNNTTEIVLELDILKDSKKKELLLLIFQEFKQLISELKKLNLNQAELEARSLSIIRELWQNVTTKYLGRYVALDSAESLINFKEIVFRQGQILVEKQLMNIVLFEQLLSYLVLEKDLLIDHQIYSYQSKSAMEIEEILTENLLIAIASSTIQFILNELSESQPIKHNLFKNEWKSSRKIAMFRNNLGWRYRREKYWQTPRNIFEDEYQIFILGYQGIINSKISHPRHQELNALTGIPWLITIMIEFVDSITRGVKALADILGQAVVFILTEILGRGIGLIGKGILQGIGKKIKN